MFDVFTQFAASCANKGFFGFPTWYRYLDGVTTTNKAGVTACTPVLDSLNSVWLIVAAIVEMLLQIAAIAAVAFIVVGGVRYITSQGEPDKTKQALSTII
ncbi:MAG: hypothetical protein JWS12_967, partial [Candidatus Saccharibacteria bacterium]|nr:hypothetical protein [Candidatus Saccharibacteria bacterium]